MFFILTDLEDESISIQIDKSAENVLKVAIVPELALNKGRFQDYVDALILIENKDISLMLNSIRSILACICSMD